VVYEMLSFIRRTAPAKGITTNLKPTNWQDWFDKRVRGRADSKTVHDKHLALFVHRCQMLHKVL
jgi:hypothetical protein